jgi:hypothetical protein
MERTGTSASRIAAGTTESFSDKFSVTDLQVYSRAGRSKISLF